jgi:hypothetical protein
MKPMLMTVSAAVGVLSIAAATARPAAAATPTPRYGGQTRSNVSGCPAIVWRLAKATDGSLHGIVWYADLTGFSEADGSMVGGHFNLTIKSVRGNGPVGSVTGVQGRDATLTGQGCANATVNLRPLIIWGSGG